MYRITKMVNLCLLVVVCVNGSKWVKLPTIGKTSNINNITLNYREFVVDEHFLDNTTYEMYNTESTLLNEDSIIPIIEHPPENFSSKVLSNVTNREKVQGNIFDSRIVPQLLSQLQHNLFSKVPTALRDKALLLKKIHDNILIHIDEKFNSLWTTSGVAEGRGFKENEHHLDFPSAESALMTISFLTFAVYLIKLILQVINILKSKKMMIAPMMTSAGREFTKYNSNLNFHDDMNMQIVHLMKSFDSI